jgi:two-component system, cell cycle sensor histidine kinase and response regulator CckA
MKLLHLEDNNHDAELVENVLRKTWPACKIKRADTRRDYLAALGRGEFDLILSDYTMPDLDGLSALGLALEMCPDKPFIFLSGTIGEERAVEALKRGAVDYVVKDRPARLVPAIRQALDKIERKHQLQQAEGRVREQATLLSKASDAIWVTDIKQRITYWNASAARLSGWTEEEALGHDVRVLLFKQDNHRYLDALQKLLADGQWRGELRLQNKADSSVVVESHWTLVTNQAGDPESILFINTDVTEKKKLEAQILHTQRMESIGTLAGGVAHNLNNSLTPILLAMGVLREKALNLESRAIIEKVESSVKYSATLVKQLLAFARGADGHHSELDLRLLVSDAGKFLRQTLPADVNLELQINDDLWPVIGNVTQLRQVLHNLCLNARDAMPGGGRINIFTQNLMVSETIKPSLPEATLDAYAIIAVSDTGAGIRPENMARIFDPFFTTKEFGKGIGLGLSTVQGIVKGHHGFITVNSIMGQGTIFRIYLPALPSRAKPAFSGPSDITSASLPVGHGEELLLIDDDPGIREVVSHILEKYNYRVTTASVGLDGLEAFRSRQDEIKLVITDLHMPGMSGATVIRALHAKDPDLRIIAISGNSKALRLSEDITADRLMFLFKPMTTEKLLTTVRLMLDQP